MEPRLYQRGFDDETLLLKSRLAETTLLLEVVAQINSLILASKSFEAFCMEVSKILQEKFKFKYIHIWIRDEKDPGVLRLVTPEQTGGYRTISVETGIVGKTIREKRTFCIEDVTHERDYINAHPETKSELCVPLTSNGNIIGVINIESPVLQNFSSHLAIIELIAANLGHSMRLALLYRTEAYFHRLVDQMSEGVWVGDREENTIYTNPALQHMTGFSETELRVKRSYDLFDETSRKMIRSENEKRKRGIGGLYEVTLVSKNGEKIPVLIHAVPFLEGGTMGTIIDLRPLKRTEQKLLRAERFLASVTQHCIEAIIGLDTNGQIQSWNTGAEKMHGYKAEEVIGHSPKMIVPEDRVAAKELEQILEETKAKGFVRNFEAVRLHKNGNPISISLSATSIRDDQGNVIGFSFLHRDITAQKKWERELQDRFEKMQDAYKEMGRQRRYLDYLTEIISLATEAGHSVKQVATYIVNALVMITKVDAATLRLLDHNTGKLILTAQSGLGEEWWTKKSINLSGSLAETASKKGHPLKILDILSDPSYTSPSLARKNNLRSALVVPLEARGMLVGSLTLYLSQEGNLSLLDDEFISIFAKQASLALKLAS